MESETIISKFSWQQAIDETYQDLSKQVVEYAPQLIGALLLLLFGWLVAYILKLVTRKVVQGLDAIFKKISKQDGGRQEQIKQSYSIILSRVVFWIVILFFITASANLLGWEMFTGWMDSIVGFLPSLITGLLIILGGFLLSNIARAAILSTQMAQAATLARSAQIVILATAVIVGIELIGLSMHFVTTGVVVFIGILLGGGALAFGLGAKTMVSNIVGIQYGRKHYRAGDRVKFGDQIGEILEIAQTCVVLDTEEGKAIIPGKAFHEEVTILSYTAETQTEQRNSGEKDYA